MLPGNVKWHIQHMRKAIDELLTESMYFDVAYYAAQDIPNSYMYKTGNVDEMRVLTKEKRDKI